MNDIAIIGTGLAGLVQALALAQAHIPVTLIGPMPALTSDDRTTAILNPGIDFLQQLGLWHGIKSSSTALVTMELVDGKQHYVYDAAEINELQFGFNISNELLKQNLIAALDAHPHVTWHKTMASAIHPRTSIGWQIEMQDKIMHRSDLLIGADGRHGLVRTAANIPLQEKNIDQHALVTVLQGEKPHYNITLELFRQGGPLTLVPMGKNKFALVWCDEERILREKMALPIEQLGQELSLLTDNRFGALQIIGGLQLWPVQPMHAKHLVAENCVLIGEAAHTLPPIGAQGFNTTLQDIIALTALLQRSQKLGLALNDPGQLAQYEATRLPDIMMRYRSVNALNSLLRTHNPLMHGMRRLSLSSIDRFNLIKKYLMFLGLRPAA